MITEDASEQGENEYGTPSITESSWHGTTARGRKYPIEPPPEATSPMTLEATEPSGAEAIVKVIARLQEQVDFEREQYEIASRSATELSDRWREELRRRKSAEAEIDRLTDQYVARIAEKDTVIRSLRDQSPKAQSEVPLHVAKTMYEDTVGRHEHGYGRSGKWEDGPGKEPEADPKVAKEFEEPEEDAPEQTYDDLRAQGAPFSWARTNLGGLVRMGDGSVGRLWMLHSTRHGMLCSVQGDVPMADMDYRAEDLFSINLEHPLSEATQFGEGITVRVMDGAAYRWQGRITSFAKDDSHAWIAAIPENPDPMRSTQRPVLIKFPPDHSLVIYPEGFEASSNWLTLAEYREKGASKKS